MTYLGDIEANSALTPLQAASCTYRIALGPRAGQKLLSVANAAQSRQKIHSSAVRQRARL